MEDLKFYKKLKLSKESLVDLLDNEEDFKNVPESWYVIVVDIQNSTNAVKEGNHHQVNLTATGAIISVLNTIRKFQGNIEIPYFFGGDGATFIVPFSLLDKIVQVLDNYRIHIKRKTNLVLRVGQIHVKELVEKDVQLKIAKHQLTEKLSIPIVLGNGLKVAEHIIKSSFKEKNTTSFDESLLNLEGMECRWDEITPDKSQAKVVCLLLDATVEATQSDIYKQVLSQMEKDFGSFENRQPIKNTKLRLDPNPKKVLEEMKISLVSNNWMYFLKSWLKTNFGKIYLNLTSSGKQYLKQIGQLSHTFMLDGMINTVFTAEQSKIDNFIAFLDNLEADNKLIYGIHVTHASVMSCYVLDRRTTHSHFVDGTEGGYTSAAKMFKIKKKAAIK
jgi:type III secretion system FlhB-like substrate exporter